MKRMENIIIARSISEINDRIVNGIIHCGPRPEPRPGPRNKRTSKGRTPYKPDLTDQTIFLFVFFHIQKNNLYQNLQ